MNDEQLRVSVGMAAVVSAGRIVGDHVGVDPFRPDYGAGYNAEEQSKHDLACEWVEDDGFAAHPYRRNEPTQSMPRIAFVDGTMRTEARLTRTDGQGNIYTGLAGSWAAGAVLVDGRRQAMIDRVEIGRLTVLCGGIPVRLPNHANGWRWEPHAVDSQDPQATHLYLQRRMRDAEGRIAETLCEDEWFTVIDGPLHSIRQARGQPVVGYVKTHHRRLLPAEDWAAVPSLGVGERTGLFALGDDFYACYLRVGDVGPWATPWAGIVRMELAAGVGREIASRVVDIMASYLPAFASAAHRDARAPVNLTPISGLERHLHRVQGNPQLALRAVREAVMRLSEAKP